MRVPPTTNHLHTSPHARALPDRQLENEPPAGGARRLPRRRERGGGIRRECRRGTAVSLPWARRGAGDGGGGAELRRSKGRRIYGRSVGVDVVRLWRAIRHRRTLRATQRLS